MSVKKYRTREAEDFNCNCDLTVKEEAGSVGVFEDMGFFSRHQIPEVLQISQNVSVQGTTENINFHFRIYAMGLLHYFHTLTVMPRINFSINQIQQQNHDQSRQID